MQLHPTIRKRLALLVSKGYFPEELPPCFTTSNLYTIINDTGFSIERYAHLTTGGKETSCKILPYSIPKVKSHRRILGIPGPFHFVQLATCIVKNELSIGNALEWSPFSIFENHQDEEHRRYIKKPDFKSLMEQRIIRSTGYRYILVVDIARFYPSIYTHSIPWAIHGKEFAKNNTGQNHYGNTLDKYCRNCQDRQTMGLPIGPDTSRIISELILSAVDKKLSEYMLGIKFTGIRNVDDYLIYFNSLADLEKGRTLLQKILREFELELNGVKEKILELPEIIENEWRTVIRGFRFREDKKPQRADLIAYFDLCFSMARKYPDEVIIPYAIAKLRSIKVHSSNWQLLQAFLLNSLILESKAIEQVVREFRLYNTQHNYPIDRKKVKTAIESFLSYHAKHDNHFELVWALWFFDQEELILSKTTSDLIAESSNDLVILSLLNLSENGSLEIALDKEKWQEYITPKHLHSEHWLLAYEGVLKGYFEVDEDYFSGYPFFDLLYQKNISFFDTSLKENEIVELEASDSSLARELADDDNEKSEEDSGIFDFDDD